MHSRFLGRLLAAFADAIQNGVDRLPKHRTAATKPLNFLGPEVNLQSITDTSTAYDGWHGKRDITDVIASVLYRRDRQHQSLIESDCVDYITNGDADGEAGTTLLPNHFGTRAFGAREEFRCHVWRPARQLVQRKAAPP